MSNLFLLAASVVMKLAGAVVLSSPDVVAVVVVVIDDSPEDLTLSTALWFLTLMIANFSFIPGSTKNVGVKS